MQHKAVYLLLCNSLYMFRVSTTPIIRSTQNCNYSLRFCAATSLQRGQAWPHWREVAAQKNMINTGGCSYIFVMMGVVETRNIKVNLQNNKQTVSCCISLDNF